MITFRKTFIYKIWAKLLTRFGKVMIAFDPPKVMYKDIRNLMANIKQGDILCRKYHSYLDGYFIKGKYSHSGVVINSIGMIHSIAEGVGYIDVGDFVLHTDGFILLRPKCHVLDDVHRGITFVKSCLGKPYDFMFKRDKDTYYCHELSFEYLNIISPVQGEDCGIVYYANLLNRCDVIYETRS